ncbi:MAG: hypothetical protein M1170_01825 [Patescibacteria group bacterium]|nr:hypothetical protein [Patescibacteria group bacterium]
MTLRTRRIIFYGLFLVFFPLAVGIIFYSQGWRIDFENLGVEKTGAAYIETSPKNVAIKLNNKTIPDQSGLIKSGTLIPDLLPKNYKLEIQKDGYWTYRKNIKVEPSMVAELMDTVLIPQKIEKTAVIEKLKGDEIIDLNDGRLIVKNPQTKIYYFYRLNDSQAALNINASFNNLLKKPDTIERVALHPFNEDRLIIKTVNGLYIFDARKFQIEKIFTNDKNNKILAWTTDNASVYFVKSKNNAAFSYNLITKTETNIASLPKSSSTANEIKVSGSQIGILEKAGNLLLFDSKEKNFSRIADNVKNFSFSPDNKKMAFIKTNREIKIYFIEDWYKNIKKKAGDIANFALENKKLIENAYWYKDSFHLFVKYKDENGNFQIDFMEIDDRLPFNQSPVLTESDSAYYDISQNLLNFTQNNTLYSIKI